MNIYVAEDSVLAAVVNVVAVVTADADSDITIELILIDASFLPKSTQSLLRSLSSSLSILLEEFVQLIFLKIQ